MGFNFFQGSVCGYHLVLLFFIVFAFFSFLVMNKIVQCEHVHGPEGPWRTVDTKRVFSIIITV